MITFTLLADFKLYLGEMSQDAMQVCTAINAFCPIRFAQLGFKGHECPIEVSVSS